MRHLNPITSPTALCAATKEQKMKKTLIAAAILTFAAAGVASAQDPAAKPDTGKARAGYDSARKAPAQQPTQVGAAIDINTASKSQLEAAGLGPYADKIIAGRPFKSTNELVDKKIVPQEQWNTVSGKVKVGAM